jgi:geminin
LFDIDNPSENYWQVLAERRQTALENTLAENKKLEQHIEVLEEKVHVYKKQLDETRAFIEILQVMLILKLYCYNMICNN